MKNELILMLMILWQELSNFDDGFVVVNTYLFVLALGIVLSRIALIFVENHDASLRYSHCMFDRWATITLIHSLQCTRIPNKIDVKYVTMYVWGGKGRDISNLSGQGGRERRSSIGGEW